MIYVQRSFVKKNSYRKFHPFIFSHMMIIDEAWCIIWLLLCFDIEREIKESNRYRRIKHLGNILLYGSRSPKSLALSNAKRIWCALLCLWMSIMVIFYPNSLFSLVSLTCSEKFTTRNYWNSDKFFSHKKIILWPIQVI